MLGGGNFVTQDKILPGAYINFVSASSGGSNLSERGYVSMPLELDWGVDGEIFTVTQKEYFSNSLKIFGYLITDEKMKGLNDLFINAQTLYAYRLNSGEKASNTYATAKCSGIRGNDLKIIIQTNVDDSNKFNVITMFDGIEVDRQIVESVNDLVDNDFVTWKKTALALTASTPLTGGTNGTVDVSAHQSYLDKIESFSFNTMGVVSVDEPIKTLYANFCTRMRDEIGTKFQVLLYKHKGDYEGVINLKNDTLDEGWSPASFVYYNVGLEGACPINKSCLNHAYDGSFNVSCDYTQTELFKSIADGEFVYHRVGNDICVLKDINSLVTLSNDKGEVFKDNQTIRVIDQIGNDIAGTFNTKYLGKIPNDNSGRISLWSDIVKYHEILEDSRAIEDFDNSVLVVAKGNDKKSIIVGSEIMIVGTMEKLYMNVIVG